MGGGRGGYICLSRELFPIGSENKAGPEISLICISIWGSFSSNRAVCSRGESRASAGSIKKPTKSVLSHANLSPLFLVILRSPDITAQPPSEPRAVIHSISFDDCENFSRNGTATSPSSNNCPIALATFGETLLSKRSFKPPVSPQTQSQTSRRVQKFQNRD